MNDTNATESLPLPDGSVAELFLGSTFVNGEPSDRMHVTDRLGMETTVAIFKSDGKLLVRRIQQMMNVQASSSPAIPMMTSGSEELIPAPLPEQQEAELLAIYQRFGKRTY